MEITLDFAATRRIVAQEYAQACADIAALGPVVAYERSQVRHDTRLAAASDATTLACKPGCSWCCHFTIDIRPVEVFRILDFMAANFSPQDRARVRAEIEVNYAELRELDEHQRMHRNIKCPFLMSGRCSIYPARPQTCRNYHATDVAGCQQSYEQPENLDIDPDFAPMVYQVGGAHVDAFSKTMHDAGYDIAAYELNAALITAMGEPETRERFNARQPTFPALEGMEVPAEFLEE